MAMRKQSKNSSTSSQDFNDLMKKIGEVSKSSQDESATTNFEQLDHNSKSVSNTQLFLNKIDENLEREQKEKEEFAMKKLEESLQKKKRTQMCWQNSLSFTPSSLQNPQPNPGRCPLLNDLLSLSTPMKDDFPSISMESLRKSKVIYVRGINTKIVTLNMIKNIFSNFGNILKLIFMKDKGCGLLEFENIVYATKAKDYMNNLNLSGSQLKIFYSNYNEITLKESNFENLGEIFLGCSENFRFRDMRNLCINPPSNILHVSNLRKEAYNKGKLFRLFSSWGKVENIKLIHLSKIK